MRPPAESGSRRGRRPLPALAPRVEAIIQERFGIHCDVIVRDNAALARALSAHPFVADEDNASRLGIAFLHDVPDPARVAAMDADRSPPDRFRVVGGDVCVHYPEGSARSKLTLDWLERHLGTIGTGRNLNTVRKLVALTAPAVTG